MPPWLEFVLWLSGLLAAIGALSVLLRRLESRQHPLASTIRATRNLILPLLLLLLFARLVLQWTETNTTKVLETLLWLAGISAVLSAVKYTAFTQQEGGHYRTRVPKLLLDLLRLLLVLIGGCFVIAGVWDQDLGSMLTAVGVSSIVLGLALQNTLDNVMAGIAVLLERPFEVGDWVQVGDLTGEVLEMNWRSMRIRTRSRDLVVVPNSVVGKETIVNLSRPTRVHGESHTIGFSYDDPPNKCKRVLLQVALATRGVLAEPQPRVRTIRYGDFSIEYQVRYFIEDLERVQEINDEFMTQIWYAARRHGLTIPFPITTEIQVEPPPPEAVVAAASARTLEAINSVPVFVPLSPDELAALGRDAQRQQFGRGERVVRQGDPGDALYVILDGTAVVSIADDHGGERQVARLSRGEFFGEMALLTGEKRNANVTAADDLSVLVIYKEAMQAMLARRPALAQEIAEIVEARRQGLRAIQELRSAPPDKQEAIRSGASELVTRIRRFLGF